MSEPIQVTLQLQNSTSQPEVQFNCTISRVCSDQSQHTSFSAHAGHVNTVHVGVGLGAGSSAPSYGAYFLPEIERSQDFSLEPVHVQQRKVQLIQGLEGCTPDRAVATLLPPELIPRHYVRRIDVGNWVQVIVQPMCWSIAFLDRLAAAIVAARGDRQKLFGDIRRAVEMRCAILGGPLELTAQDLNTVVRWMS